MELPRRSKPDETKGHSKDPPVSSKDYVLCPVVPVDASLELFGDDIEANQQGTLTDDSGTNNECLICLGDMTDKLTLTCGHEFCKQCVQSHCEGHNLFPILCPHQECEVPIPIHLLKALFLNRDRLHALIQHYKVRQHPQQFKSCPFCQHLLQLPSQSETNDLQCGQCQRTFCRTHDTEHLNVLCKNHTETVQTIDAFSKPCSHCGTYLQKSGGCDHVVCQYCNGDFCWQCGTHEYLSGKVRKKCSKCGFYLLDYRYEDIHRRRLLLWMPLILPLSIIYTVIMMVLCPITLCCCGCMCWGEALAPKAGPKKGTLLTLTIIFFPFIALLNDFGVRFQYLADLFPDHEHSEIPYLETKATIAAGDSASEEFIASED